MKRSIEETDNANENDARQKLKDSLIPFDQSREASEALLLQCCYSILERQQGRSLNVRCLVHVLNRTVAPGAFTKRGEERTASAYVKQILGGCRAWVEALPADVFEVVGSWEDSVQLRLVSREDMTDDDAFVDGERRRGKVEFWDRGRGWGRISLDGDSRTRVFVHSRDVVARKQLPRGGRVDLRLKASEKGWCGEGVRLLEATDAEVDALLGSSAMALSETLFLPVAPDPVPPPPLANSPEPPRPVTP
jgi:cold shock CspA family protein